MKPNNLGITRIPGIKVGHAQNEEGLTGCTVILCPPGTIGGVDQRGGAPGTRETDLLRPMHLVNELHAVFLAGGSAYGLDAAAGIMRYLEENDIGYQTRAARVPIVTGAVIYDLDLGKSGIRPDKEMGYQACLNASEGVTPQGNIGAGTGARVGSIFGIQGAMKSGLGSSSLEIQPGLFVGALFVVNAFGDVLDHKNGEIIAGARTIKKGGNHLGNELVFANTMETMRTMIDTKFLKFSRPENTVIGVVATNAKFNKEEINKIAQMAHNGIAQVIRPAHTMLDGDIIFAVATRQKKADVNLVGAFAAEVSALAINLAVLNAEPAGGLPSASEFTDKR